VLRGSAIAMISRGQLAQVLQGHTLLTDARLSGRMGKWRVLAAPAAGGGAVAVAEPLHPTDEALGHLLTELAISVPFALLLASLAGYLLAASALRPVEAMRRRAREISAETPGRRLPVPARDDEIARLGTTLNEMLARIEAAVEHERRFVADASHELRTPLALLKTELELALRRPRSNEELEIALRSAAVETDRLTRIAEDLLLLARSQDGRVPLQRTSVEVAELLGEVAGRFAARAREAGREIAVENVDGLRVEGDPLRLEQALDNLVDNALHHGAGTVRLSARAEGDRVELHVHDDGGGFPPEFLDRAFERFSRADDARGRGGSGLGLAIVELIAAAHGGKAGAANTSGGADVWIEVQRTT
ncbi:MAG: sensor histidine kinase, partial [Gaiellaceae bacterium]